MGARALALTYYRKPGRCHVAASSKVRHRILNARQGTKPDSGQRPSLFKPLVMGSLVSGRGREYITHTYAILQNQKDACENRSPPDREEHLRLMSRQPAKINRAMSNTNETIKEMTKPSIPLNYGTQSTFISSPLVGGFFP